MSARDSRIAATRMTYQKHRKALVGASFRQFLLCNGNHIV